MTGEGGPTPFPRKPEQLVQPPQPLPLYDFKALADPPDTWAFLDVLYGRVEDCRVVKVSQLRVLVKHYFWGIDWAQNQKTARTTRKAHNQTTLTKALWKLFWYMQDEHRPKSYADLLNLDRDTGPRLLRYDITPRPPPLSQWFPNQPDDRAFILPAYFRPLDAPLDLPDVVIQQYMYSADSFNEPTVTQQMVDQPFGNEQHFPGINFAANRFLQMPPDDEDLVFDKELVQIPWYEQADYLFDADLEASFNIQTTPRKRKRSLSPSAPNYRGLAAPPASTVQAFQGPVFASRRDPSEWTWQPGLQPEYVSPPPDEPQVGPIIQLAEPVYEHQIVAEAIEKALMQVVYADLERDPSAPSRNEPVKNITAHRFKDLLQMKIGAFSNISSVRVSPITFKWDSKGASFPLRGRGPVWHADSCATDCVIMVGRLLDVGCTRVDRANNRSAEFTEIEKSYIEATNIAWEILDEKMAIRARDEFLQKFIDGQLHLRMGEPLPPWAVWSQVTKSISQFRYHHIERVTPCKCENTQSFINYHEGSCILPGYRRGDDKGVAVGTLIERCFYDRKSFSCKRCGDPLGVTGERRVGQLPLRLVMTFDVKTRLRNHTQHLSFKYTDYDDKKRVAHYRWLGGIYNNEEHARVYWTDSNRGEQTETNVMMYDSQLNKGLLLGGVPAFKPEDRVPNEWVNQRAIPLLFYERIMDPSSELLASAHTAVSDMASILQSDKNVLEAHVAWIPPSTEPQFDPWDRVLSDMGERFTDYNPSWGWDGDPSVNDLENPSATNVALDPALIDPTVIDQSLLDPSLYSNTSAPVFDISAFLESSMMDDDILTQQIPQGSMQDILKTHLFQSMLDTPDWLSSYEHLWPSGKPSKDGALEFPDLPTWPSPKGRKRRRMQSDTSMPDAYDQGSDQTTSGEHKAIVMLSQNIDPRQREAYENHQKEQELQAYLKRKKDKWWSEKKKERKSESEEQIRERNIKIYEAQKAKEKAKEEAKQKEKAKEQAAARATVKSVTTRIPPTVASSSTAQQRGNAYSQSKAIQDEKAKQKADAVKKAAEAEAEAQRQAKIDERKAKKEASKPQAADTGAMKKSAESDDEEETEEERREREEDEQREREENERREREEEEERRGRTKSTSSRRSQKKRKGKGKAKDDDPTWMPGDDSEGDSD
ncbi:hypothetical protein MYU51_013199 [Penicillium brevicompactum]